jgi:hypothetical protein
MVKKLLLFTAIPVYIAFPSHKWKWCHGFSSILDSILKFTGKKSKKYVLGTDTDPDRHALDADTDPSK